MHHQTTLPIAVLSYGRQPPSFPLPPYLITYTSKHLLVLYSWVNCNKTVLPPVTQRSSRTILQTQTTRRHTTETVRVERNAPQLQPAAQNIFQIHSLHAPTSGYRRGLLHIFRLLGFYAALVGEYRRFGTRSETPRRKLFLTHENGIYGPP